MTQEVIEQQETAAAQATEQAQTQEAAKPAEGEGAAAQEQEQQQEAETQQQRDERGRFKPGVQQRIDELTRQRHEAEREATYWRQRAGVDQAQAPAPAVAPKPTPDKFNDYADYVEALTEWKAEQKVTEALSKRDQQQAERAQQTAQQAKAQTFAERQQAARTAIPDYDEVMSAAADVRIAPHVHEALLDSKHGPAIAYHLAKNPDEAERLSTLPPLAAARELGRLEASLAKSAPPQGAAAPALKPVSKAPAPIKPIGAGTTTNQDPARMSMDEYAKWRKAQGASWAR